jgi:TP901 family phage tail tape measure protein
MNKDLQIALKINVDKKDGETNLNAFNRAFESALINLGKTSDDIDAFNKLNADIAEGKIKIDELDSKTQELYNTYKKGAALAADRDFLGLKAHTEIHNEIDATKEAYNRLKASGKLTQAELSQAALKTEERIRELKKQTSGWTDALNNARGSIAAMAGAGAGMSVIIGEAIEFEAAMANVKKVVDGSDKDFANLINRIKEMSAELPVSADGLAQIAAAGGQLGMPIEKLDQFIELAAKMSVAFDLSVEQAGNAVAKLSNIFNIPIAEVEGLGDAINVLGNTTAAKEADILNVLTRIGGTASQFKLTAEQSAALAATMIEMGATSEVAGTGINALLSKLQTANVQGSAFQGALQGMGITAEQLADSIRENPQQALTEFLNTLSKLDDQSKAETLTQLFGQEYQDDIARLLNGLDNYEASLTRVTQASATAGAMQDEFSARMETTEAQIQLLKNGVNEIAINLGSVFLPLVRESATMLGDVTNAIANFVEHNPEIAGIATTLGTVAVSASALKILLFSMGVVGSKTFAHIKTGASQANTSIKTLTTQVGLLGTATRSVTAAWAAWEVGYKIGDTLREKFAIVEKAGIQLAGTLTMGFEYIRAGFETVKALFTDDTIDEAIARHKERLSEMQQIYGEMLAEVDLKEIQTGHTKTAAAVETQTEKVKELNQEQSNLAATGNAAAQALSEIDNFDIGNTDHLTALNQALKEVETTGTKMSSELQRALGDITSDVDVSNIERFKTTINETFADAEDRARILSTIIEQGLSDELAEVGLDMTYLKTGIDESTTKAIEGFSATIKVIQETGTEAELAADAIAQAYQSALDAAGDNEKAIEQVEQARQQATKSGVVSEEALQEAIKETTEKTEEAADKTQNANNATTNSNANAAKSFNQISQAAKGASESIEESANGAASLASFVSDYVTMTVESLTNLSAATANLFKQKLGLSTTANETEQLRQALESAEQAAFDAQTGIASIGVDTTGLNSYMQQVKLASASSQVEFYKQKIAYQDLIAEIESGSLVGNDLINTTNSAIKSFDLLDSQSLSNLTSAISSAKSEMDSLNNSAQSTLSSLRDELDQLRGNTNAIEDREYEAQKSELENALSDAKAAGNDDAARDYREALSVLEKIRKETLAQRAEAAAEESATKNISTNNTTTNTSKSSNGQTFSLNLPSGGTVTASGDNGNLQELLDVLSAAQLTSTS